LELILQVDERSDGAVVIHLEGAFNQDGLSKAKQACIAQAAKGTLVVLELAGLTGIDSAGWGFLIGLRRRCEKLGGELCLAAPPPDLMRGLIYLNFTTVLNIFPTVDEALLYYEGLKAAE
jgi:anti-sigma B factor antagonist/stage II sporulation protein AA (anti-sigma F factor antagonist)